LQIGGWASVRRRIRQSDLIPFPALLFLDGQPGIVDSHWIVTAKPWPFHAFTAHKQQDAQQESLAHLLISRSLGRAGLQADGARCYYRPSL
jgi:hypothetical protein